MLVGKARNIIVRSPPYPKWFRMCIKTDSIKEVGNNFIELLKSSITTALF
jgi:hypothetical protein